MRNYSDIERLDAHRINEIDSRILNEKNNWDNIFEELKGIYDNLPSLGYLNCFEEDGKYYYKFWDQEEFVSYCQHLNESNSKKDVVWIGNAYPKCCYYLAIICIERGDFKSATTFLEKGIELEPDNPRLLSEMGLLLGEIGTNTGNKDFYNKAIYYYDRANNSRQFNTDGQKARALRGIGFILIELGENNKAKELYEASLSWEESDNARSELKIIAELQNKNDSKVFRSGSNFNDTQSIHSFEYFDESKQKLPKILQDKIPNKYVYIWSKSSLLLSRGFSEYRANDFFKYPLVEWDESEMTICANQIVHYLKGFDTNHYIDTSNIENAINLLLTFHFEKTSIKQITNKSNEKILSISFQHKVDKDEITLFFRSNKLELKKKKWWNLW
jgi:tetratricopeptide (TPR) repeat protein